MTAELDAHKQVVEELRSLRNEDEAEIEQRCQEVEELRGQVESLGAEVHRLRGIIEESVRERRAAVQQQEESQLYEDEEEGGYHNSRVEEDHDLLEPPVIRVPNALSTVPEEESQDPRLLDSPPIGEGRIGHGRPSSRLSNGTRRRIPSGPPLADDSIITNEPHDFRSRATVGSSGRAARRFIDVSPFFSLSDDITSCSRWFIQISELERVESDVEERRSFLSTRSFVTGLDNTLDGHPRERQQRAQSPANDAGPSNTHVTFDEQLHLSPGSTHSKPHKSKKRSQEAFPQIRGARMEKLFFSLPDHNEATCHVCRRRGNEPAHRAHINPHWKGVAAVHHAQGDGYDNALGAGDVSAEQILEAAAAAFDRARKQQRGVSAGIGGNGDDDEGLPPQAVIARVLRELEDDFTHVKSCVLALIYGFDYAD